MEMNVYEDGDKVGVVCVDIENDVDVRRVLVEVFDCDDDVEFEKSVDGDEVYIGINECEYLWNK